jgi:hypothetical protein
MSTTFTWSPTSPAPAHNVRVEAWLKAAGAPYATGEAVGDTQMTGYV